MYASVWLVEDENSIRWNLTEEKQTGLNWVIDICHNDSV